MKIKKEENVSPATVPKDQPLTQPTPKTLTATNTSIKESHEKTLKEWLIHILYRPSDTIKFIKHYNRYSIGIGASISFILLFYIVVLPTYYSYMLSSSETAFSEKRYQDSIYGINRYLAHDPDNADVYLLLAKNYLFSEKLEEAKKTLAQAKNKRGPEESLEIIYYNAILQLLLHPKAPNTYIEKSLALAPRHIPTLFAQGLDQIVKRNWLAAQQIFSDIKRISKTNNDNYDEETVEKIYFIINYFFKHDLLPLINATPPISFSNSTENIPLAQTLGFDIGYSGFQNLYYIPYDQAFLSTMQVLDIVDFLLAVTYVTEEKYKKAKTILAKGRHKNSIWSKYCLAYVNIKQKDYENAVALYQNIVAEQPSSDSLLMLANAKWIVRKGKATDNIVKLFKKSYDADNNNIPAINNLAFVKIYEGEEDLALELLTPVWGVVPKNKYLTQNLALLELALDSTDTARQKIYTLLENNNDSVLLRNAVLFLEDKDGDYQSAIEHANAVKKLLPDSSHIYLKSADIYSKTGDHLLQLLELEKGHAKHPQNKELFAELVLEYTQRQHKNLGEALPLAIESIGNDYRILLAQALLANGEIAVDFFNQSLEQAPQHKKADISYLLGRFYLRNNNVRKALTIATLTDTYNERQKFKFFALKLRAKTLTQDVSASTLKENTSKVDIKTSPALAVIDIAWAFLNLMQTEQAIAILKKLLQQQKRTSDVLDALLFAYRQQGDTINADATVMKISTITKDENIKKSFLQRQSEEVFFSPGLLDKLLSNINLAISNKQYVSAISLYTELLQRQDIKLRSPASSYQNRGALYINIKKYKEAAADFSKALSFGELNDTQKLNVYYNYAYSLLQIKNYNAAIKQIQAALALKPKEQVKYLSLLGLAYSGLNDIDAAVNIYEELIRQAPDNARYYLTLANIQRKTGELNKAIKTLLLALNFHQNNPNIHFKLAEYYTAVGNTEKGRNHLKIYKQIK